MRTPTMLSRRQREIIRLRTQLRKAMLVIAVQRSGVVLPRNETAELDMIIVAGHTRLCLVRLLASRYMISRRRRIPKSTDWRDRVLHDLPPLYFRAFLRVEKSTFDYLRARLDLTARDLFYSESGRPQLSVAVQLSISLYRLGHYGNGASVILIAQRFGVSPGTVVNATRRVLSAVLRWEADEIRWPTAAERESSGRASAERYGFCGCIGAVDGTTIPFAYAPSVDPWCYFDRHRRYSVNVLVVCDWDLRIISLVQGFTGAAPDTVVQAAAPWHKFPLRYFSLREYLLGDKGMLGSTWVLLPHKGPAAFIRHNRNYNFQHARRRIPAEKVIGVLKGRFASLRELRAPVATEKDFTRLMEWVAGCAVLHNVCMRLGDNSPEETPATPDSANESQQPLPENAVAARSQLQTQALQFMIAHGLYHG